MTFYQFPVAFEHTYEHEEKNTSGRAMFFKGCALYFWVTPVTRPNEPFISELEYNPRRKNPSPEEIPSFSVIILGIN